MNSVKILDKHFSESIPNSKIQLRVEQLANEINKSLSQEEVVFLVVLNGAFMFASDLYRKINFESKISFLKLASYEGVKSCGEVKQLIGLNETLKGKTVVVIEDIIDTGNTLSSILKQLKSFEPAAIKIATLLFKPDACKHNFKIDFVGFSIPNDFIVGYGLDYNGLGRNLDSIYSIINT
jgi:hypoxanthine phosphoribosyltransferase